MINCAQQWPSLQAQNSSASEEALLIVWNCTFLYRTLHCSYPEPDGLSPYPPTISNKQQHLNCLLTFICLRATTLSYDVAHRTVRSWRQNSFDWFSRWPWNTLCNYMCGVSLVAGRCGGSAIGWGAWSADCGQGVVGNVRNRSTGFRVDLRRRYVTVCVLQEGVGGSFQQYFYNRYKIVVYTGLRSDSTVYTEPCFPIQASMTLKSKGMLNTLNI
jgi:hypothetical protein